MADLPPAPPPRRRRRMAADPWAGESRFRSLVDGSIQGILVHRGIVPLFANPAAAQMLGYATPEELVAVGSVSKMLAPHERRRARKLAEARLRGDEVPSPYELQARRKDGSLVWLEIRSSIIDWDGGPAFQVAVIDIDDRKRAEAERAELLARLEARVADRTAELRSSEAMYRGLVDNLQDGVFLVQDDHVSFVNPALAEMLGRLADSMIGQPVADFVTPEHRDRTMATHHRRVAGEDVERRYEIDLLHKDGNAVPVLLSLARMATPDGRPAVLGTVRDMRERRRAEDALRESEERFQALLDNSPQAVNLKDAEGRYLLVNAAWEDQHGVGRDRALGRTSRDVFGPATGDPLARHEGEVVATGKAYTFEATVQLPDGGTRTRLITKFPVCDRTGRATRIGTVGVDITERKAMEQAIRDGQERFREFAESSSDWLWETDAASIMTFVSDRIRDLLGIEPSDVAGRRRQAFAAPGQEAALEDLDEMMAARQPIRDFRYEVVSRHGQRRWLSISGRPRYSEDDRFLGYRGTGTDITERIEAGHREAQVHARFLAAIETVPVALALFDEKDRLVVANARFRAQLSAAGALDPGTRFEDYCRAEVAAGGIVSARDNPEAWIAERMARHANPSTPFEVCRTNGWFQVREHRTADGDTLVFAHDITDRKRAEQTLLAARDELEARVRQRTRALEQEVRDRQHAERALQEANQDLEKRVEQRTRHLRDEIAQRRKLEAQFVQAQKMEAVGQLAGGIAHDFNNLLMVIQGNLSWLADRLKDDEDASRLMAMALEAARRAGQLTHRVLAFSRRQDLRPERLDLRRILENVTPLAARALSEAVALEVRTEEGLWPPMADPHQLESAILNVVINARDAMPGGGTFVLSAENRTVEAAQAGRYDGVEPGEYVCLSMRDSGTGMPPEVLEHAFEPFFTTKEVGKGSGLGLSMVFGFARQSGGFVELASQPAQGTTVDLYLPRSLEDPLPVPNQVPAPPRERPPHDLTVLVVEDDPLVRTVTTEYLRMAGFKSYGAADGRSALDAMAATPDIDLVLSDVIMPDGLSGLDLAGIIGQRWPGTPVLLMTGYSYDEFARHGIDPDAADILRKPFTKRELLHKIDQVLAAARHRAVSSGAASRPASRI